jgi:hypothetical protein
VIRDPAIVAELERIATRNGGLLKPEKVVEAARREESPLHSHFDWNDTAAAQAWRIHQARNLIRVVVTFIGEDKTAARVFVSLTPDRPEHNGYRAMTFVMGDEASRKQLLADALEELARFQQKYSALKELAGVFAAMRKLRKVKAA